MPHRPADAAVHRIECGCDFAVEGAEDEVVDAARRHAHTVHGIDLADGILRALARPIDQPTPMRPRPNSTTEPGRQEYK